MDLHLPNLRTRPPRRREAKLMGWKRDIEDLVMFGLALAVVFAMFLGCGDSSVSAAPARLDAADASAPLPACLPPVYPDHYCPDGRVACWEDPKVNGLPAKGASGCTVEVVKDITRGVELVECVESCFAGTALPAVNCAATVGPMKGRGWCSQQSSIALDAQGLEMFETGEKDCYAPYSYPPYVLHQVVKCPGF
jgi:hypothetical protein